MQRQVTWPGRPVASTMARSVAALTLSWNDFEPLPSDRSFERIVYDAPLNGARSRAKGMRIKALRQAPAASSR